MIRREFTDRVNINPDNVHGPDGAAADIPAACQAYEDAIRAAGGVDLQLLGVGTDGHIGFNEPGSSLASRTRIKTLIEQTRRDNARFFGSLAEVPHHVLTQGLGTILDARHVILIATGAQKAQAVRDFVEGPVAAICPASVLQTAPARHRPGGRGRGVLAATRRLLPAQLRQQAALAGSVAHGRAARRTVPPRRDALVRTSG